MPLPQGDGLTPVGYLDDIKEAGGKNKPPPKPAANGVPRPAGGNAWAEAALAAECAELSTWPEGGRNHRLNIAALKLGGIVAGGYLDEQRVRTELEAALYASGMDSGDLPTIDSGLGAGMKTPRHPSEQPNWYGTYADMCALSGDYSAPQDDGKGITQGQSSEALLGDPGQPGEALEPTWAPQQLDDVLSGTYEPELPSLMPRTDGKCLLYPGRIHSMHGESESGKSLVAQAEAARLLEAGQPVLFIDFESDRAAVAGRMLELGATPVNIREHFTYVHPEVNPWRFAHEKTAVDALLGQPYALAVIDGVTDALGTFGLSTKDNDDIATFLRVLPRVVATRTGAAVVLIDHVTKDADTRGRFAIGGQAKMAGLDGAAYVVEVTQVIGRGLHGTVTLRVGKDRPGGVRAIAGRFRKTDRTQEVARIGVDSTTPDGLIHVTVNPQQETDEPREVSIPEQVSLVVENSTEPLTKNKIADRVGRQRAVVLNVVDDLVQSGHLGTEGTRGGHPLYVSTNPFRDPS